MRIRLLRSAAVWLVPSAVFITTLSVPIYAIPPAPHQNTIRVGVSVLPTVATYPTTLRPGSAVVINIMPFYIIQMGSSWQSAVDAYLIFPDRARIGMTRVAGTEVHSLPAIFHIGTDCSDATTRVCTVTYN